MTVVTEKDKWNKIISHGDMLEFQAGPIGKLFQYLRLELGCKVKVYWVEKLPPKNPK